MRESRNPKRLLRKGKTTYCPRSPKIPDIVIYRAKVPISNFSCLRRYKKNVDICPLQTKYSSSKATIRHSINVRVWWWRFLKMVFMHVFTFLKLKRSLVASEGFLAFSNLASSSCTISSASEVYKYDIFIEFEIFSTNYTTHLWTCLQASKLLLFHNFPSLIFGLLWYGCPRQIQQHTHINLRIFQW